MKKLSCYILISILITSISYSQDMLMRSHSYNSSGVVLSESTNNKVYISFGRSITGTVKSGNKVIGINSSKHFFGRDDLITREYVSDIIPSKFSLQQNYPNPFNPSTNIKYDVPEQSRVNISIFNILGERVFELVNEEKSAGSYEVTWNAHNISNGVYVYIMRSGDFVESKKLILLK